MDSETSDVLRSEAVTYRAVAKGVRQNASDVRDYILKTIDVLRSDEPLNVDGLVGALCAIDELVDAGCGMISNCADIFAEEFEKNANES